MAIRLAGVKPRLSFRAKPGSCLLGRQLRLLQPNKSLTMAGLEWRGAGMANSSPRLPAARTAFGDFEYGIAMQCCNQAQNRFLILGSLSLNAPARRPRAPAFHWPVCVSIFYRSRSGRFTSIVCARDGSLLLQNEFSERTHSYPASKVDGLEHSLAWRPAGNLLAASQRLPHRHELIFFERNGLR